MSSWKNRGAVPNRSLWDSQWERDNEQEVEIEPGLPSEGSNRVLMTFSGDQIAKFSGVMVEMWDKVITKGSRSGSKYRRFCEEFSEAERTKLRLWHNKMYGWYLRTGHPKEIAMRVDTYELLVRAGNFFASV